MNTRTDFKRLICCVLAVLMLVSLAACSKNTPEKALDAMLTAIKSGDMEAFAELTGEEMDETEDINGYLKIFSYMSWSLGETVMEDDETATVNAQITTKDMQVVFTEYLSQAMNQAMQGTEMTEEYAGELLISVMEATEETKTFDVAINMTLEDGKWQIDDDNDVFFDAITGGLLEVMEDFS